MPFFFLTYGLLAAEETAKSAEEKPAAKSKAGPGVDNWDDRVFDVQKPPSGPKTSKGVMSGTERYLAEEPEYNSKQREEWLDTCSKYKENSKAYRDCYGAERKRSAGKVKESVERTDKPKSE